MLGSSVIDPQWRSPDTLIVESCLLIIFQYPSIRLQHWWLSVVYALLTEFADSVGLIWSQNNQNYLLRVLHVITAHFFTIFFHWMPQIVIQVYEMTLNCLLLQYFFQILDGGIADYLANPPQANLVRDASFMWKEKKKKNYEHLRRHTTNV